MPIGLIIRLIVHSLKLLLSSIKLCIVCYKNGYCSCSRCHKEADLETEQETESLLKKRHNQYVEILYRNHVKINNATV